MLQGQECSRVWILVLCFYSSVREIGGRIEKEEKNEAVTYIRTSISLLKSRVKLFLSGV